MLTDERELQLTRFLDQYSLKIMSDLSLLDRALTHSSCAFELQLEHDNERLEFLGDSVLGLVVSEFLFSKYPGAREGVLSKRKSQIISRSVLGKRAVELGIGNLILLGKGEEQHGGRNRPVLLGSALEAVVGALYLDLGLAEITSFLQKEIFEPALLLSGSDEFGDYKSLLQEHVQKCFQTVPEYEILSESGPDHSKDFAMVVRVNGEIVGEGHGVRKKSAENQAAMQAYWKLTEK